MNGGLTIKLSSLGAVSRGIGRVLVDLCAPHRLYMALAGIFGLIFILITPPMGGADEPAHFERAYEAAIGAWLGAEGTPKGFSTFVDSAYDQVKAQEPFTREDLEALHAIPLEKSEIVPYENPYRIVLRIHNPLAYAPYVPVFWAGLAFDLPPATIFMACRFVTLLFGIFLMAQAIRILPSHQYLAALIALLPTPLSYMAAVNIDVFLLGTAFLFFALIARHAKNIERPLTNKHIAILAAIGLVLGCLKTPYILLPLITFLLPAEKFRSMADRLRVSAMVFAPGFVIALIWAFIVKTQMVTGLTYSTPVGTNVNSSLQLAAMLADPFLFPSAVWRTLFETNMPALSVFHGIALLAWWVIVLPLWVYVMCIAGIVTLWADGCRSGNALAAPPIVAAQLFMFATISLAALFFLYLQWNDVGSATVEGFHGRYFLPITPLLFFAWPGRGDILPSDHFRAFLVTVISVLALSTSLIALSEYFRA